jgi:hypothetical protein
VPKPLPSETGYTGHLHASLYLGHERWNERTVTSNSILAKCDDSRVEHYLRHGLPVPSVPHSDDILAGRAPPPAGPLCEACVLDRAVAAAPLMPPRPAMPPPPPPPARPSTVDTTAPARKLSEAIDELIALGSSDRPIEISSSVNTSRAGSVYYSVHTPKFSELSDYVTPKDTPHVSY